MGTLIACVVVVGGTIIVGIAIVVVVLISKFKKALDEE